MERGEIPGPVFHIRAHGRALHERAFGRRRVDTEGAPTLDGLFSAASLTKLVVAAAVLRLCDEGRLSLDEAIVPHLPDGAAVLFFGNILDTAMSLSLFSGIAAAVEAALSRADCEPRRSTGDTSTLLQGGEHR